MKHRSPLIMLAAVAAAFVIMFIVNMLASDPRGSSAKPAGPTALQFGTAVPASFLAEISLPASQSRPQKLRPAEPSGTKIGPVVIAFAIGTAVSIGLGAYGRLHTPTGYAVNIAGFSSGAAAKAALASVAMALAIVQIITAMGLYGRIPLRGAWVGAVHRWSGRLAVLISVPVAVHCLYALGFQAFDGRVITHSLFGCFLHGAFVFKMLILTRDGSPGWALPLAGGLVLSGLTALWMTAVLYFFFV